MSLGYFSSVIFVIGFVVLSAVEELTRNFGLFLLLGPSNTLRVTI